MKVGCLFALTSLILFACDQVSVPNSDVEQWIMAEAPEHVTNPLNISEGDLEGLRGVWTGYLLSVSNSIEIVPDQFNDPWFDVAVTLEGEDLLGLLRRNEPQLVVDQVNVINSECRDNDDRRYCGFRFQVTSSLAENYAAALAFDPLSVTTYGDLVLRQSIGSDRWEVYRHDIFPAIRSALETSIESARTNAIESNSTDSLSDRIEHLVYTAQLDAFDQIALRLSNRLTLTDYDTILYSQSELEFSLIVQFGSSFNALQNACRQHVQNGLSDWRLPTEREFSVIFDSDFRTIDTPDRRFWLNTFERDTRRRTCPRDSCGIENSFFLDTFCEASGENCVRSESLPLDRIRVSWFGSDPGPHYFPVTMAICNTPARCDAGQTVFRHLNRESIFSRQPWSQFEAGTEFPAGVFGRALCVRGGR
jgi:hypothetical protein